YIFRLNGTTIVVVHSSNDPSTAASDLFRTSSQSIQSSSAICKDNVNWRRRTNKQSARYAEEAENRCPAQLHTEKEEGGGINKESESANLPEYETEELDEE
ncbi:2309_t:CDS:1, partial [Paraglomus occultum]